MRLPGGIESPASLTVRSRCQTLVCFQTTLGACGQMKQPRPHPWIPQRPSVQSPPPSFLSSLSHSESISWPFMPLIEQADPAPPYKPLPSQAPISPCDLPEGGSRPFIRVSSSFPASLAGPPGLHISLSHPSSTTPNKSPLILDLVGLACHSPSFC